jgi:hypothetical protein
MKLLKYLQLFEEFNNNIQDPKNIIILDGTSSSGKSFVSKKLKKFDFSIIAVDSFYNVIYKDSDATTKYNDNKTILDIYGKVWYKNNPDNPGFINDYQDDPFYKSKPLKHPDVMFNSVQYYMMREIKECKIWQANLKDDDGNRVGRNPKLSNIIIDDIQPGCALYNDNFNLPECKIFLLYAPLDILKRNVIARAKKDARDSNVFLKDFVSRYVATTEKKDSIDDKSWTKQEILDLLNDEELFSALMDKKFNVNLFLDKLGINDDAVYWIKIRPEIFEVFNYTLIINMRYTEDILSQITKLINI